MQTLKIEIVNQDAMSILKGMEQAGLIVLPKEQKKNKNLSKILKGSISGSRAMEMIESINKDRSEWEKRY